MDPISTTVDVTDPITVVITYLLTEMAGRFLGKLDERTRHIIPVVAVLLALLVRGCIAASNGEAMDTEEFLRAVAAGSVVIAGHSQGRELLKANAKDDTP